MSGLRLYLSSFTSDVSSDGVWSVVARLSIIWSVVAVQAHPEWEVRGRLFLAWMPVVRKSGLRLGRPVWTWMVCLMPSDLDLSGQRPSELGCVVWNCLVSV